MSHPHEGAQRGDEAGSRPGGAVAGLLAAGTAALGWVLENEGEADLPNLLGYPFTEYGLRVGTEQSLRDLARETRNNRAHRFQLVDLANYVRPATWF